MSNLPPIRVHVEDGVRLHDQKVGLEEHFSQLSVAAPHKQEEGFVSLTSPRPVPTIVAAAAMAPAVTVNPTTVARENSGRVYSDDEPSDHGAPVGFRKLPQPQLQQKMGVDLPSPDATARDANSRPKPVFYQDPVAPASPARDNRVPAIHVPFGAVAAAASSPTRLAAIPNGFLAC
ncbi:uncharacterized protein LOC122648032 [Telopea speciosissima]|uniref:uncharacterized protein LOC122648032 n=1 Tax=Telopea speciosissima TaxID=54955 RepID=UPI001CC5B16F|nr:uncharacterized protein LOC122648032 [Telopea speciosissima]